MSKLVLFGANIDWNREIEVNSIDEFGMDVIIHLKDGTSQTRNNCTEFHHRFDSVIAESSAFESDIHSTGGTMELKRIDKIEVVLATKKHENY